jgi:transposase
VRRDQCRDGIHRVYWIPVYEILEQRGFEVILVNARYAKNVPGRGAQGENCRPSSALRGLHGWVAMR